MSGNIIVVTRPKGDEAGLTLALQERGYQVVHEPLTEIFLNHPVRAHLEQALQQEPDAVIATSKHGVRSMSILSDLRDMPLLCVGEATAHMAENCGYTRISTTGGSVARLIDYVLDAYDPGSAFVYVSAAHVRQDLEAAMANEHMQIERIVTYEAIAATQLADTLIEQIRRNQVHAFTFLSQRSATIFMELAEKAELLEWLANMQACALSAAIAEPLYSGPWQAIHIADEATLASLVECVDNTVQK